MAQVSGDLVDRSAFRVCADPAALPFSDDQGRGFEHEIAVLFAAERGVPLIYTWYPRGVSFIRQTLRALRCDVVMGVASGDDLVLSTNPYYRSTYVLVRRTADAKRFASLDSTAAATAKLGVIAGTPPADLIANRGWQGHTVSYRLTVDSRVENPGRDLVQDVANGTIDVGFLWGPTAAWWAKEAAVPLTLTPLAGEPSGKLRMDYRVGLGVRSGEQAWKHELEASLRKLKPQIDAILVKYGVPMLDAQGRLIGPVPPARADAPPEPDGYRMADFKAPVPATLKGATVLDAAGLEALISTERAILIDVLPRPEKPANRPPGSVWVDKPRLHIPGSAWLPNTGFGELPPERAEYLRASLDALTGGDPDRPLVFYCDPDCWMSWNAARRAMLDLGYQKVFWFPDGAAGYAAAGRVLEAATVYASHDTVVTAP